MSVADLPETLPQDLACSACGDDIERGYVTASEAAGGYEFDADGAVCDVCGWQDVGATGCAPTLADFAGGDLLVRIEREDGRLRPVDVTDD